MRSFALIQADDFSQWIAAEVVCSSLPEAAGLIDDSYGFSIEYDNRRLMLRELSMKVAPTIPPRHVRVVKGLWTYG